MTKGTPQWDITWFLLSNQGLYHCSKLISGCSALSEQGVARIRYKVRHGLSDSNGGFVHWLVTRRADQAQRRVTIDLLDSAAEFSATGLANSDVYFKRDFARHLTNHVPAALQPKLQPLGLNYACLSGRARLLLPILAAARFTRSLVVGDANTYWRSHRSFRNELALVRGLPQPKDFEAEPRSARNGTVVYQTRVWPPDQAPDDYPHINDGRVTLVQQLQAGLGDRFDGGIVASDFVRDRYPSAPIAKATRRLEYAHKLRQASVGVYTRGIHASVAFKLAEYMAAGLCIVSEPILHELPVPLEPGIHFLPFETPAECLEQCRRLLTDRDLSEQMSRANVEYYRRFVEPAAHVQNILTRLFADPRAARR